MALEKKTAVNALNGSKASLATHTQLAQVNQLLDPANGALLEQFVTI